MKKMMVVNIYPPILDRRFDWQAFWDGDEDVEHTGWGATREAAIADLRRLDQEREQYMHG